MENITFKNDLNNIVTMTEGEFKKEVVSMIEWATGEKEYQLKDLTADFISRDITGNIAGEHGMSAEGMELIEEILNGIKGDKKQTYVMVWEDESETWHYFINDFYEDYFPHGYVDYYIEVQNDIILSDDFHDDNAGKKFSETYNKELWNL